MKVRELLEAESSVKKLVIELVLELNELAVEWQKLDRENVSDAKVSTIRRAMFKIEDKLRDTFIDLLAPIIGARKTTYWIAKRRPETGKMNLNQLVDNDEVKKKIAARLAQRTKIFPLLVAVESEMPDDVEDRFDDAIAEFRDIFGADTKVEVKFNKETRFEVSFNVEVKLANLK